MLKAEKVTEKKARKPEKTAVPEMRDHFEHLGITPKDLEEAIKWARKKRDPK